MKPSPARAFASDKIPPEPADRIITPGERAAQGRGPSRRCPQPEFDVFRRCLKILVRRQQNQFMPATELDEQGIHGSDLDATTATGVANLGRFDMVLPVWLQERERGESFDNLDARLRPRETLQQFLENEPGREHLIRAEQRVPKCGNLRRRVLRIAAQGQRPNARVDEKAHRLRVLSAL